MIRARTIVPAALVAATLLTGCSDDDAAPAPDTGPQLGPQIERMGRAGINTLVTDPFFRESVADEQALHGERTNAYDAETQITDSTVRFATQFRGNLAVYDGLDRVCGNQLLAAEEPGEERNGLLALVLANDALFVNTDSGVCEQYLAVELDSVGMANTDCGGRTLTIDAVDTSYSALVTGELSGVDDGVDTDRDGVHSNTAFPFLDAPLPPARAEIRR